MRAVGLGALFSAGVSAVRARLRVVLALYIVQLGVALVFTAGVSLALARVYGERPLFARGVAGDDVALIFALRAHADVLRALAWVGVALLAGYAVASLYLTAGMLGALSGRGFGATAAARFGGFVRLQLWSLLPWLVVAVIAVAGVRIVDPQDGDMLSWAMFAGRPLLGLAPALLLAALTCCAIDLARAELVLRGGGSGRALLRGLRRAVTQPRLFVHYLLYGLVWLAVSALFMAATFGRDFPGSGGALLLFLLRQTTTLVRFLARATTSGGQLAALELDVVEVRQVVKRPEPAGDVGEREVAQAIQRRALDGE